MNTAKVKKMLGDLDEAAERAIEMAREAATTGEKDAEAAAMRRYGLLVRAEECLREVAVELQAPLPPLSRGEE